MLKAKPAKEIVIKVRNEIGVLAQLARTVADKGIDILATAAWVEGGNGIVHLVTSDNLRAMDALKAKSFQPRESEVVLTEVPHKPGMLRHVTEKLAAGGIDLHHLYASATTAEHACLIVFASANNDRAVVLLNE